MTSHVDEQAAPVAMGERIAALDILRGFAVLGILLANITAFSNVELAYYWPPALPGGAEEADGWIWLAQMVAIDGKLRGLFTVLFGAGMVLFVERTGSAGGSLQLRRLAWLMLFGLLHFYLLFAGDILFGYATAGLLCLLTLHWRTPQLLGAGFAGALAGGVMMLLTFAPSALAEMQAGGIAGDAGLRQEWAAGLAGTAREQAAMTGTSLAALLQYRLAENSGRLGLTLVFNFLETIPLILIGMGLFRAGLFTNAALRRRWRAQAWAGVVLGLTVNLAAGLYVLDAGFPPYLTQAVFFGVLALANLPLLLGGLVLLTDWANAIRGEWLGERLGQAGRMAFTNYIGTSAVMALIFQGWAGAEFGTMHRAELLLVVLIGWGLMITGSRLWLARYRQGPLEWLWRCLTYGRWFPNRI